MWITQMGALWQRRKQCGGAAVLGGLFVSVGVFDQVGFAEGVAQELQASG